ncbi:hypothetical protein H4W79_003777 [Nocardiopsis terrae]|uniref:Uncharacterized protein n=1 Tax=Nocardiopsis terrae TaxID=372655 RepID=A0ABR9HKP8_9ACTN|nr:hypothetical protein [Nocardiopsis terrae]MBE1459563.1 hypothetical protein [Nocardiopsis terrae]
MPSTGQEPEDEGPVQPNWLLSLLVALVCLAVVVSGWSVARLTLGGTEPAAEEDDPPQAPQTSAAEADPRDAEAFLGLAARELREAPSFHISYTQSMDGEETGHGWARHEPDADTAFEHFFRTASGVRVHRYDLPGTGLMMTAEKGLSGMTVLDPPSEADLRLCSVEFALATLDELADSAEDLKLVGTEELTLPAGTEGVAAGTHTTYRYTGTFPAPVGGYEPETGRNTLTRLAGAEFDLWVDEDGHPRRLGFTSPEGVGATYDYHALAD